MGSLARHVIVDYYGCDEAVLDDVGFIEESLVNTAEQIGATIVTSQFHQFSPYGVSGTVVIAESHLTIHTWPEYGYAAIDVFTCGDRIDPRLAHDYLVERFSPQCHEIQELERGARVRVRELAAEAL